SEDDQTPDSKINDGDQETKTLEETVEQSGDPALPSLDAPLSPETEMLIPEDRASLTDLSIQEAASDTFMEVRYTIDGETWKPLGVVGVSNWENRTFEINDPLLTSWEDLSKLQVSLKTIRTYDNQPVVYVDSVGLTIDYETIEPVVVEEVVDPPKIILKDSSIVLSGDSDYGAENPPVFIVKNPELTTEDVNQL